ncbi:unnamed protein product [Ascophyllum nodosum]
MLDYRFLDSCVDTDLIRSILQKLRSGEEGLYPDLIKHAENRLLEELPQVERSKILRMMVKPKAEEIYQASSDLHEWEDEIAKSSSELIHGDGKQRYPPIWSSCTETASGDRISTLGVLPMEMGLERASPKEDSEGATAQAEERGTVQRKNLGACDFRAWQKYDADRAIMQLEEEEEEEQTAKDKTIEYVKQRVQQDEMRRAKKREDQLQELSQGRFKKSLSLPEKKCAAERERIKGNESFKARDYEEAFRCYTFSLALDETSAKVFSNRAAAAHKLERYDQAEDDCSRAITLDSEFKRAWMRRGMARHSRGKYASAVNDFKEALLLDPHDKNIQSLLKLSVAKECEVEGEAAQKIQGSPRKRGRVLIEELDTEQEEHGGDNTTLLVPKTRLPSPPLVRKESKETVIGQGLMDIADEQLNEKCETYGVRVSGERRGSPEQPRRVMVTYDSSEDEDFKDVAWHTGTIPENVSDVRELMETGGALYKSGDFSAAADNFMEAIQIQHGNLSFPRIHAANNLCASKIGQGLYEEALRYAEQVLEVEPQNSKALFRKWLSCIRLNESRQAAEILSAIDKLLLESFREEIQSEASDVRVPVFTPEQAVLNESNQLRKEGNELMKANHPELAIEKYTAALKKHPLDLRARNNRAQIFLKLEHFEAAEADAEIALLLDPGNIKAIYRRGRACLSQPHGDKERACKDFARVLSDSPENKEALDSLVQAVDALGLDGPSTVLDKGYSYLSTHTQGLDPESENDLETSGHKDAASSSRPSMIIEDVYKEECSSCPLTADKCESDQQVAQECCHKGKRFLDAKNWTRAMEMFSQGVVADPSNAACWIGLSRVHRKQGNYRESSEAAFRACNIAETNRVAPSGVAEESRQNTFVGLNEI